MFNQMTTALMANQSVTQLKSAPLLLSVDSYKGEHWWMINEDVDFTHGYVEARRGDHDLQVADVQRLSLMMSESITPTAVMLADQFAKAHSFGTAKFNVGGWMKIASELGGKLPIEIKALPEGTVVKPGTPVIVVRNTVAGYGWVVNYFIDKILKCWKGMSVAGKTFRMKRILKRMADATISAQEAADFWLPISLHDFGSRSIGTSEESAASGMAALQNIAGSDNWEATFLTMNVYNLGFDKMPSGSVAAMEHNVILSYPEEREHEVLFKFIREVLTKGRVGSVLIDTFDIDAVLDAISERKDEILEWYRQGDSKGKMVLRPDSGDSIETPIMVAERMMQVFGSTMNDKGFRELPPYVGVIQGDSVSEEMLEAFNMRILEKELSAVNFVFGCGGELISNYTRDEDSWCGKVTNHTMSDGEEVPCSKKPKYGAGKTTKDGYFRLTIGDDNKVTYEEAESFEDSGDMVTYFKDGEVFYPQTHEQIRARANSYL